MEEESLKLGFDEDADAVLRECELPRDVVRRQPTSAAIHRARRLSCRLALSPGGQQRMLALMMLSLYLLL